MLLLLPLAVVPLWLNRQHGHVYSTFSMVPQDRLSQFAGLLLRYLSAGIITSLVFALSAPAGAITEVERTGKGAQVVLVIDRSASMDDPFAGAGVNGRVGENKSTAAKRLITRFVDERKDDMVGMVTFSNSAMYAIPLTQNREAIHAAIAAISRFGRRPDARHARFGQRDGLRHRPPAGGPQNARRRPVPGIQKENGHGAERSGCADSGTRTTRAAEGRRVRHSLRLADDNSSA